MRTFKWFVHTTCRSTFGLIYIRNEAELWREMCQPVFSIRCWARLVSVGSWREVLIIVHTIRVHKSAQETGNVLEKFLSLPQKCASSLDSPSLTKSVQKKAICTLCSLMHSHAHLAVKRAEDNPSLPRQRSCRPSWLRASTHQQSLLQ